eukprot:PLAT9433.2.p1 GENE.PLAT9433.2~~PLAT9433.2.p1  ORF type:complete len:475 (+),score=138.43 PLAT9433.2:38-1462(+)
MASRHSPRKSSVTGAAKYSRVLTGELASSKTPWGKAMLVVTFAPATVAMLALVPSMVPWKSGDGLSLWLAIGYVASFFFPAATATQLMTEMTGIQYAKWKVAVIGLGGAAVMLLAQAVAQAMNAFPCPFASVVGGSPAFSTQLTLMLMMTSGEERRKHKKSIMRVMMILTFMMCMFSGWMAYRALFIRLSGAAQAVSIVCLPLLRLGCVLTAEWFLAGDYDKSGALALPVAFGVEMYNALFNASLFSSVSSPTNAALIILADMAGTFVYFGIMLDVWDKLRAVFSCCRSRSHLVHVRPASDAEEGSKPAFTDASALGERYCSWQRVAQYSPETLETPQAQRFRWKLRISGFLLVEEFVELQVPLIMMLISSYMKYGWNGDVFPSFSQLSDERFALSLQYLALAFLSELALFVTTSFILWRQFHIHAISHLYFLMKRFYKLLIPLMLMLTMFTATLLATYNGIDFSFEFAWIPRG